MEETAGGGPRGCTYPTLDPADCQGANSVSRRIRARCIAGFQPERTPGFSTRRGLLQHHQLPPVLICSLNEHVKIADDRLGVKTAED